MSESLYTKIIETTAPTTSTVGVVGQWYLDSSTGKLYELKSIDSTASPVTYNWVEVGAGGVPIRNL